MLVNRFTHKYAPPPPSGLKGSGVADELARKGIAYIVKRATPQEEATSRPGFAGERHALLLSQDGKRYVSHAFTGPNTNVDARLARGDKPIDQVDEASMMHDIAYNNMSKRAKAGTITREQHLQGIKVADAKFINSALSATDRPLLGKIAANAIRAKAIGEQLNIIPTSAFSGAGKLNTKHNHDPCDRLRKLATLAVRQGTHIVAVEKKQQDKPVVDTMPTKRKTQLDKVSGKKMSGGFPPLLVALAGSLLTSLATTAIEKLIQHFSADKKGSGVAEMSRQEKIDLLQKHINPVELINQIQAL